MCGLHNIMYIINKNWRGVETPHPDNRIHDCFITEDVVPVKGERGPKGVE